MLDASYMDWVGCCDHDNGAAREYTWWISQKLTDIFYNTGKFVTMFHYERSVQYQLAARFSQLTTFEW